MSEKLIQHLSPANWPHYQESSNSAAWGIFEQQRLVAVIETLPDEIKNGLKIVTFQADAESDAQAFIELAKEQAQLENRQFITIAATTWLKLFLKNGFSQDSGTLTWLRSKPEPIKTLEIRPELEMDFNDVETMINQAFWNKFQPGSIEAYLLQQLRKSAIYLPKLSRIAIVNGEVGGGIFYSKAEIQTKNQKVPILTFGPLGVAPKWQGTGIGTQLLKTTLALAKQADYQGVVITGVPNYYRQHGFQPTVNFGITLPDGTTPDFLMGYELQPGGLRTIPGIYQENEFFEKLSLTENDHYNERFNQRSAQWFPQQL
ncbi:GNAT family N-acetyltransferase [Lapidilactobacillus dextrinicus]|uniref:GNAT family N-acetyltransferase n=1 Tax=Lapidilactobacillus dextrinicus TaxID=51664 RepID=UPI003F1E8A50